LLQRHSVAASSLQYFPAPLQRPLIYYRSFHSQNQKMPLKTLGAKQAADLDKDLMSEAGGFSIDQLMELVGLSCSQAVYKVHPPSKGKNVLIACGPGNNGGDGLVCARHLHHYGYTPTIYYPKPSSPDLFKRLVTQLKNLSIPFTDDFPSALSSTDFVIDAIFGFSVKLPIKAPFDECIAAMEKTNKPVLAIDTPSSWDVEGGPQPKGELGHDFMPDYLISLTAAKPSSKLFKGKKHFVGGRFLSQKVADKYELDVPDYQGYDQIAELPIEEGGGKL